MITIVVRVIITKTHPEVPLVVVVVMVIVLVMVLAHESIITCHWISSHPLFIGVGAPGSP